MVCVDEMTGLQALERKHRTRRPKPGRPGRWEFEYIRHGTRTLIAGFDIRTGRVYGQVRKRRTAVDLVAFMEGLAERYPTGTVYIVWDNLNVHYDGADRRWTRFNEQHGDRFIFVYTPKHASWLNQVEIWFSILRRRVLRYASFSSSSQLAAALRRFISNWNRREAHPFRWTFRGPRVQNRRRAA